MGLVVLVNVFDRPPQMRGSAIDGDEFQVPYQSRNEDSHTRNVGLLFRGGASTILWALALTLAE